jgi:hypothetical protein
VDRIGKVVAQRDETAVADTPLVDLNDFCHRRKCQVFTGQIESNSLGVSYLQMTIRKGKPHRTNVLYQKRPPAEFYRYGFVQRGRNPE